MSVSLPRPPAVSDDSMSGATELVGTVGQIRYRDEDSGFTVLVLSSGVTVKLEDPEKSVLERYAYRFLGRWSEHAKYGRSFQADVWALDQPNYQKAVIDYLVEFASGIGVKRAEQLWQLYGADAVTVLRERPECVSREAHIPEDECRSAAEKLAELQAGEAAKLAVYRLLAGRGLPRKTAQLALAKWGRRASEFIQRNPLALVVARFYGCGFRRVDRLYGELGHPPDKLKRQTLAAWDSLRRSANGSTWVLADEIEDELRRAVGPQATPGRAVRLGVRAGLLSERESRAGTVGRYLADGREAADERTVANLIRLMTRNAAKWPDFSGDEALSEHQRSEFAKSLTKPVGLLLGTPGTGKTYATGRLVRAVLAHAGKHLVAVCAPTGKAAVRVTAAIRDSGLNLAATTIHKLLEYRPGGFTRNARNPLDARYVVVDEASMLDCTLAARLLEACAAGTHLLLVGDPYQLPPVGHGAPLRDFQAAGLPTGLLTEVRRNGGLITSGCALVKDGSPPLFCDKLDLAAGDNLRLVKAANATEALDALSAFLLRVRHRHGEDPKLPDAIDQTQVIVAANKKSDLSRKAVNTMLQGLLNADGVKAPGLPFRVMDKVICLRNGWYAEVALDKSNLIGLNADDWRPIRNLESKRTESYVANGEIGRCVAVARGSAVFRFDGPSRTVKVGVGAQTDDEEPGAEEQKGLGCSFDLAYAVTCHKAQGSQWPYVVVMADPAAGMVASREWIYTALSRAEKMCLVIGLWGTIEKQVRRRTLHVRKTFLKDLLTAES